MIYLIDIIDEKNSHIELMLEIINRYTDVDVDIIDLPANPSVRDVYAVVNSLFSKVKSKDVVFCPWAIDGNIIIDNLFTDLACKCWVVAAAGNLGIDIQNMTPARASGVITVGSLNKAKVKASHSNYSDTKQLEWVVGTNYTRNDGSLVSGTSVSSAIYASLLSSHTNGRIFDLVDKYNNNIM